MTQPKPAVIDAIVALAEEIGRCAPECADKAMQIAELARGLAAAPDRAAIQDAVEADRLDNGFSDVSARSTASAVARALEEE
jgi:hypothetical protein